MIDSITTIVQYCLFSTIVKLLFESDYFMQDP